MLLCFVLVLVTLHNKGVFIIYLFYLFSIFFFLIPVPMSKYSLNIRIKCSLFFERVHLHYYAIILSYCNYIISEIKLS